MAVVKYAVSMVIAIVATAWAFQFVSWSFELWPTTPIYKLPLALSRLSIIIFVYIDEYLCSNSSDKKCRYIEGR